MEKTNIAIERGPVLIGKSTLKQLLMALFTSYVEVPEGRRRLNIKWNGLIGVIEGSLELKLLTIWTDEKTAGKKLGRGVRREEKRFRKSEERRCRCAKR